MNYLKKILISLIIILFLINALSIVFDVVNNTTGIVVFSETFDENDDKTFNTFTDIKSDDIIDDRIRIEGLETKVGDYISFGKFYDINDKNKIERIPVIWKVLDKVDGYSLLISKDIIKSMPYNTFWIPTNWKESNLRFWLNHDFYDLTFNDEEKQLIKQVELDNTGNKAYNISCDYKTLDKVFLLSIEEVKKYDTNNRNYIAVGTKYAKQYGLWVSKYATSVGYSVWWLRSPGKTAASAAIIHADGSLGLSGDGVATHGNGVRPCIWVKSD